MIKPLVVCCISFVTILPLLASIDASRSVRAQRTGKGSSRLAGFVARHKNVGGDASLVVLSLALTVTVALELTQQATIIINRLALFWQIWLAARP